ncbi:MAG: tyrosine-type recombinase/integrase [Clostridiales bacterium]
MGFFDKFKRFNIKNYTDIEKTNTTNDEKNKNISSHPLQDSKEIIETKEIILENFKKYLSGYDKWSKTTKETYYNSLKNALSNQEFSNISEIDINKLKDYLYNNAKRKNDVSKVKNSLALLFKSNNEPMYKKINEIEKIRKLKPKGRKQIQEELQLKNTLIKINALKNKKLKLAYRLMVTSGLRISEISNLKKKDIEFCDNDRIKVHVTKGKGDKRRKFLTFWNDKYLYDSLKDHVKSMVDDENLFYSESHMRRNAGKLSFKSHDLRKTFSHILFYHYPKNEKETINVLQKLLGHNEGTKTYLVYKDRKINLSGTKYDI